MATPIQRKLITISQWVDEDTDKVQKCLDLQVFLAMLRKENVRFKHGYWLPALDKLTLKTAGVRVWWIGETLEVFCPPDMPENQYYVLLKAEKVQFPELYATANELMENIGVRLA